MVSWKGSGTILTAVAMSAGLLVACNAFAGQDYLGVAPPKVTSKPARAATCAACHGAKGIAAAPNFPNLAGQNYNYLLKQLEDFRTGKRTASPMSAMVKTVPAEKNHGNFKALAAYFSHFPLERKKAHPSATKKITQTEAKKGYKLYAEGDPDSPRPIPACAACHLATGMGNAPMAIPRLAGQNEAYLVSQLHAFASGKRHNATAHVMDKIASRLTDKDINAVSAYLSHMQPDLLPGGGPKTFSSFVKSSKNQKILGIPAANTSVPAKP